MHTFLNSSSCSSHSALRRRISKLAGNLLRLSSSTTSLRFNFFASFYIKYTLHTHTIRLVLTLLKRSSLNLFNLSSFFPDDTVSISSCTSLDCPSSSCSSTSSLSCSVSLPSRTNEQVAILIKPRPICHLLGFASIIFWNGRAHGHGRGCLCKRRRYYTPFL